MKVKEVHGFQLELKYDSLYCFSIQNLKAPISIFVPM